MLMTSGLYIWITDWVVNEAVNLRHILFQATGWTELKTGFLKKILKHNNQTRAVKSLA